MLMRTLVVVAIAASIGSELSAQEAGPKSGDLLVIKMTGDLAKEYARRIGSRLQKQPAGLEIETVATVAQQFDDGRIRIEHSSPIKVDGKPARLVTLTGTVDPTKITTDVVRKGTPVYASPNERKSGAKPMLTSKDTKTSRLHLSNLKGLKLRTWTLSEELGE